MNDTKKENVKTLPEGFRRLSSKWLETNVAPKDVIFYYHYADLWGPSQYQGKLIPSYDSSQFTYATARTDLPREAYADERAEESKTPEVDAAQKRFFAWLDNESESICPPNGWAIARTMEREVATLLAQKEAKEAECQRLQKDNKWLRDTLTNREKTLSNVNSEVASARTERDKLLAECRKLRELLERRAETIAVAMHNQKVNDQNHASTVSSIRSENDKLRAEVEHRTKQRDEFQNLFIEASDGFNRRGEQLARLTAELDAVRKELQHKEADRQYHMSHINRLAKAVGALGETSEAVIDTALAAKDAAERALKHHQEIHGHICLPTEVPESYSEVQQQRDAAQARCGELERAVAQARNWEFLDNHKEGCQIFGLHPKPCSCGKEQRIAYLDQFLTPSQQPDNLKGGEPCAPQAINCNAPVVGRDQVQMITTQQDAQSTESASNPQPESPIPSGVGQPSRPEPVKAGEWLPMETAPKRKVRLRIQTSPDSFRTVEALWINGQWDFDGMLFFKPVGWKPIAPEGKATEGEG